MRRATVIGGGPAGMLAAAALAPFCDRVTLVERDVLPHGPHPRKGLPQARHGHVLWSGGAKAIERLVPGVTERWPAAGAVRVPLTSGMVAYTPHGWFRRRQGPTPHHLIACGRDLLDWHVRDLVLRDHRIRLLEGTEAVGLTGAARRITGVRTRSPGGSSQGVRADLVVDAGGRGSRALHWLASLGITGIRERSVDSALAYASRVFRAPDHADGFPVVNVQAAHGTAPGQAAALIPIEDGRRLVSLSGTRGGEPTSRAQDFVPFTVRLRHPLVGRLIERAAALTEVSTSRSTANGRRYFEQARQWPEGLVVLGDAVATHNPVYGQGMSVAALAACLLRDDVRRAGVFGTRLGRRVQRAVARPADAAWASATALDVFYPGASEQAPTPTDRMIRRLSGRLARTAAASSYVANALTQVTTMEAGTTRLLWPDMLLALACGPLRRPLAGPPLTAAESRLLEPVGPARAD
ncbi:FAD-dependent monooxygenase [Streptomyces sp. Tue6028]|uniref:FAD-dependent monooxygenase n=1 Tax=Streptomyces sp. Tue6028 TaxID=2036037 RepID=UPI00211C22F8|nr:FAD-dependent monooxygenase [Streptomyces sp. Tue6028]